MKPYPASFAPCEKCGVVRARHGFGAPVDSKLLFASFSALPIGQKALGPCVPLAGRVVAESLVHAAVAVDHDHVRDVRAAARRVAVVRERDRNWTDLQARRHDHLSKLRPSRMYPVKPSRSSAPTSA